MGTAIRFAELLGDECRIAVYESRLFKEPETGRWFYGRPGSRRRDQVGTHGAVLSISAVLLAASRLHTCVIPCFLLDFCPKYGFVKAFRGGGGAHPDPTSFGRRGQKALNRFSAYIFTFGNYLRELFSSFGY